MNHHLDLTTPQHSSPSPRRARRGFTLIELLVVIAIIALLAAMIFPITKALNRTKIRNRARGELALFETAIESYKAKLGVYPPDNKNSFAINQLYYELKGTALQGKPEFYKTLDGDVRIDPADIGTTFNVGGFVNSAKPGGGDEGASALNFLKAGLPFQNVGEITSAKSANPIKLIVCSIPWPKDVAPQPVPNKPGLNPWRYNSSSPTNNPNSYDLWVDVMIDGKKNRISNWSKETLINVP